MVFQRRKVNVHVDFADRHANRLHTICIGDLPVDVKFPLLPEARTVQVQVSRAGK